MQEGLISTRHNLKLPHVHKPSLPQVCHLCSPPPRAMATPIACPQSGHLGPLCVPLGHSADAPTLHLPRRLQPAGTKTVAEPRHCRHLVGVRWRIALKHMGFQHQQTKTPPFAFGIGSVCGIALQKTVRFLQLSRAPHRTVNP